MSAIRFRISALPSPLVLYQHWRLSLIRDAATLSDVYFVFVPSLRVNVIIVNVVNTTRAQKNKKMRFAYCVRLFVKIILVNASPSYFLITPSFLGKVSF